MAKSTKEFKRAVRETKRTNRQAEKKPKKLSEGQRAIRHGTTRTEPPVEWPKEYSDIKLD